MIPAAHRQEDGELRTATQQRESDPADLHTGWTYDTRARSPWDPLGILALASLGAAIGFLFLPVEPPGYPWLKPVSGITALFGTLSTLVLCTALLSRQGLQAKAVVSHLSQVWTRPPRDWIMFIFGWLIALPLFALHSRVILGDSDSGRILASIIYVQRHGVEYLVQTQESLLPHLVLGPFAAVGGIAATKLYCVLSVQALAGVVSFVSFKLTRMAAGALVSVLALLSFDTIVERAVLLPMYSTMLALGVLGVWLAHRAIRSMGRHRWVLGFLSGLCIVLSSEAHALGQLFFITPLFLIVTDTPRAGLQGLLRVYTGVAVFFLPRAVINVIDGGFTRFLGARVDYWITKGYLEIIQIEFWQLDRNRPLTEYLVRLPDGLLNSLLPTGILVVAIAMVALLLSRGRLRLFALLCFGFFIALCVYQRLPFFPRYFSQLMVGAALAAGGGAAVALRRRSAVLLSVGIASILALFGTSLLTIGQLVQTTDKAQREITSGPLPALSAYIDDGKGVIGARAGQIGFVNEDIPTYGGQFLTEEEYVTYLSWPSDAALIEMMKNRDIGWVLITARRRFEIRYHNTWLLPAYGKTAKHVRRVNASSNFCRVAEQAGYSLYKLISGDECPAN